MFYTLLNLQGSQTDDAEEQEKKAFYTLLNLQGSQTEVSQAKFEISFTLFLTYKVLKRLSM